MIRWVQRSRRSLRAVATAVLLGGLGAVGCSKPAGQADTPDAGEGAPPPRAVKAATTPSTAPALSADALAALHQPFEKAARDGDSPPPDIMPPTSETSTNKRAFELLAAVRAEWDKVR